MKIGENMMKRFMRRFSKTVAAVLTVSLVWMCIPQSALAETVPEEKNAAGVVRTEERTFVHPGMLHTAESFAAMKANVDGGVQPAADTWNILKGNGFSAADWNPRVTETIIRGVDGDNSGGFYTDIRRAYQTAIVWKLSGSKSHGEAACRILNAWSAQKPPVEGNADRFLAAGIYGYELANVAEIMRDHPDFDAEAMKEWLLDVSYPMTDDFMKNHNGAHFGNYWANWDLCTTASMMAIGIFTDRADIYEQALEYYKTGIGMGSLYNAMPYVYEEGLAQWQESGRDQGHSTLGISLCGAICEMAWNQGDDLYGLSDNRFLKGAEYVAKYNNNEEVPYNPYERYSGQTGKSEWCNEVSELARGSQRPVYSLVYNHYVTRLGLKAPNIEKKLKAADGTWNLELEQSRGDEFGWQSLTFALTGKKSEPKTVQGDFADGIYRIRSAHTGKSLVADEAGTISSARRGMNASEWWKFENTGDGEYIITNTVTGQVLRTGSPIYSRGSSFETGARENALNERFAFVKNEEGIYRMIASVNGFAVSLSGDQSDDTTPVIQWKHRAAAGQSWIVETKAQAADQDKWIEAEFDFDDEVTGFECETAKASGGHTLVESHGAENGKALYLDGTASQFLTITDREGKSLLAGAKELTVSMEVKPDRAETNWLFYAAPDEAAQTGNYEHYIGILQNNGKITAERYNNNGNRPVSPAAQAGNDWIRVDVVLNPAGTAVYINGEKAASESSWHPVDAILGDSGILQIGKANWGDGEYYKGWIDNLTIRTIALSDEDVKRAAAGEEIEEPAELPFEDVKEGDWFYDGVSYNYFAGTMTGIDPAHFAPLDSIKRAQFALIIHRMSGEPEVEYEAMFPDVKDEIWYTDAIIWAADAKIVTGYTDSGYFGPADYINREQMAVMMYRYAKYLDLDVSETAEFDRFEDADKVTGYAGEAMRWAVGTGIITGKYEGTKIDPQGSALRGECAIIIQRFMDVYFTDTVSEK